VVKTPYFAAGMRLACGMVPETGEGGFEIKP
jgi:hypothetical protein